MYEFIYYQVRDVMQPDPITVGPEVSLALVAAAFEKYDFNGIPVVDREQRLLGMITKLDLLKAFVFRGDQKVPPYETIMTQEVSEVMTRDPQVFFPESPLTRVLQKMVQTWHKSFPVVVANLLVGIVTREDILRALQRAARCELPSHKLLSDLEDPLFAKSN